MIYFRNLTRTPKGVKTWKYLLILTTLLSRSFASGDFDGSSTISALQIKSRLCKYNNFLCGEKKIFFKQNKVLELIHYFSGKITLGQKSLIYPKIHIIKPSFFTKFTISKSHFSQNSQFHNLIFHKIHNFKISFFTKFTISKSHFSQNSQF